jgi:16S rRNA G1207 methylase RsmC
MTTEKKLYACGNNSDGALAINKMAKEVGNPTEVKLAYPQDRLKVELVNPFGGSLYSMALCRTTEI